MIVQAGCKLKPKGGDMEKVCTDAQAYSTVERFKVKRYRDSCLFLTGFLFGVFIGFMGGVIVMASI